MSPYDIIPLIMIVISLAGIIFIVVRKFSVLAAIDVSSIKSNQEAEKKEEIIASRFLRKAENLKKVLLVFLSPGFLKLKNWFKKIYDKVLAWERSYAAKKKKASITPVEAEKKVKVLFFAAEEDSGSGRADAAEQKYIEIISLDHKNVEAYKKLGRLYVGQKNYTHAEETFQHILKLNSNDSETLIDLGLLAKQRGENERALENFKKAVAAEPTNPKYLDFLIEMSIIVGNKVLARETLEKLRAANPENQKLDEFGEGIGTIG